MKILRAVIRRGFDVESAGYFTVLKPNRWFAASRLRIGRARPIAHPDTLNPTTPTLDAKLNANDPGWLRLALTILGGLAITVAVLWWIMSEAPPNSY